MAQAQTAATIQGDQADPIFSRLQMEAEEAVAREPEMAGFIRPAILNMHSLEEIVAWVKAAADRGRAPLVCVAEGFMLDTMTDIHSERGLDAFGRPRLGGIGEQLAPLIEEATGIETRATTLGHIQRGGTPSAFDRVLATRFGMNAARVLHEQQWGHMVALRGTEVITAPFSDALGQLKTVPAERWEEASLLFG